MAEEANPPVVNSSVDKPATSRQGEDVEAQVKEVEKAATNGTSNTEMDIDSTSPEVATENATVDNKMSNTADSANDEQSTADDVTQGKPATSQEDTEMEDTKADDAAPTAKESATPTAATPAASSKARRKSGGVPEHKGKKLNKKVSKAKMTHTDAKPGDYFYVRLKGYPLWPAVVADESMLPNTLLKNRPVTAAKPDGTYRDDFEDGGPKVKDRTFPVMYLHTNEFGFIPNYDLVEIDFDEVANISSNMRKDLAEARRLAAEKNDLDYFKEILRNFVEQREADKLAKEEAKAEKKAKKAAKKSNGKSEANIHESDDEGDVEMTDIIGEDLDPAEPKKNGNGKRENEDTEARPESVKKPRIKLNTSKTTNGSSTPKVPKEPAAPKSNTKAAPKKRAPKAKPAVVPEVVAPKEPELSAEEKAAKKEKEILFLRHKLQKGLLTRDQEPKADEMKSMSEYVLKLEGYADLEVSIIRQTKINKVLKAILKLGTIPKEEEFKFKPRSQALLDKWNKLLASESGAPATNGDSTEAKADAEDGKASPAEPTNGVKESSAEAKVEPKVAEEEEVKSEKKLEEKTEVQAEEEISTAEPAVSDTKDEPMVDDAPVAEETAKDVVEEAIPVEAAA